jgi:hypothetical protein
MDLLVNQPLFEDLASSIFNPMNPRLSDMQDMTLRQLSIISENKWYQELFSDQCLFTSDPNKLVEAEYIVYLIDLDMFVMKDRLNIKNFNRNIIVFELSFTLTISAAIELLLPISSIVSEICEFKYSDGTISLTCDKLGTIKHIAKEIKYADY